MKIQCDVCERAAAAVLCCADEAALCWGCDEKVHAANKLAEKHQRVPLLPTNSNSSSSSSSSSSQVPVCDICQEKAGYFFCLEDRALLCRQCDVAIHTASPYVSSHQRFLITGVRVALQHHLANGSNKNSGCSNGNSTSSNSHNNHPLKSLLSADSIAHTKLQAVASGYAADEGLKPQWPWNEFLDGFEFDRHYGLSEPGSSS
ncbi:B-box zinc finger protein 22-like [Canna indica]|uniref:B-box zinc finger protein 22-like n=1 Tax=Canna indica TaxID=4628 RepID=A0AAQ3K2N0_9LILI|nr:B-box zinc finger protein 22-like [Canna indica]